MSKSNSFENLYLRLILKNENIPNLGDATGVRGSSAAGNLYLALHTADPGEAGSQNTSEASYGGYARVAIPRGAGFDVAGNVGSNAAAINFAAATSGSQTVTHWSLGTDVSGAGTVLYKGSLTPSIAVTTPVAVSIPAGDLDITED